MRYLFVDAGRADSFGGIEALFGRIVDVAVVAVVGVVIGYEYYCRHTGLVPILGYCYRIAHGGFIAAPRDDIAPYIVRCHVAYHIGMLEAAR